MGGPKRRDFHSFQISHLTNEAYPKLTVVSHFFCYYIKDDAKNICGSKHHSASIVNVDMMFPGKRKWFVLFGLNYYLLTMPTNGEN